VLLPCSAKDFGCLISCPGFGFRPYAIAGFSACTCSGAFTAPGGVRAASFRFGSAPHLPHAPPTRNCPHSRHSRFQSDTWPALRERVCRACPFTLAPQTLALRRASQESEQPRTPAPVTAPHPRPPAAIPVKPSRRPPLRRHVRHGRWPRGPCFLGRRLLPLFSRNLAPSRRRLGTAEPVCAFAISASHFGLA
jgi:hypothetical protein